MPDDQCMEDGDIVRDTGSKTISIEMKCIKERWLSEEALQIAVKKTNKQNQQQQQQQKKKQKQRANTKYIYVCVCVCVCVCVSECRNPKE